MTRRRAVLHKRTDAATLCVNEEVTAAGMLYGWIVAGEMHSRRWWQGFAAIYGDRVEAKVREHLPGTRPGFAYAIGRLPPVPLIEEPPEWHLDSRCFIDIDGDRFWYAGPRFQRCQAEHLKSIGELDGAELKRYRAWRDHGFPVAYPLEGHAGSPCGWIHHGCY
jgi:hypothetical protein